MKITIADIGYVGLFQPGDVPDTYANVDDLVEQFHYKPATTVNDGIQRFVDWYREFYG